MSQLVQHYVAKKVKHEFGVQDPYYEAVKVPDASGGFVMERRKRQTPPGISAKDEKLLRKLKKRAYRLELVFSVFGVNVGWTAVIGFIPFVGVAWNLYLAYQTIKIAEQIEGGLDNWDRSRMMANVSVDFGLGFMPFLGDVLQAVYKCNTRNVIIVEHLLSQRGARNLRSTGIPKGQLTKEGQYMDTPDGRDHL